MLTGITITGSHDTVSVFVLRNVVSHNAARGMHIIGQLSILAQDKLVVDNGLASDAVLFVGSDAWAKPEPITGRFVNNTLAGPRSSPWVVGFVGEMAGLVFANNVVCSRGSQPAINCYSYNAKPVLHRLNAWCVRGGPPEGSPS